MFVNHINRTNQNPTRYNPQLIRELGERVAQNTVRIMGKGGYQIPTSKKH